jgi:transcriptional regulator with XRE-family HTH domain
VQVENFLTAVKGWIERLGLSLAEAAQRAGMDPAELGRILEATQRAPSLGVVLHLLERLGLGIVGVEPATVAGLLTHLESCRATRPVSLRMLAERAGVDRNNLKRLLTSQDQDPRLDTILRLASALECDLVIAALRQPATVVPPEVSVRSAALVEVAEGGRGRGGGAGGGGGPGGGNGGGGAGGGSAGGSGGGGTS